MSNVMMTDGIMVDGTKRIVVKNGVTYNIPEHINCNNVTTINQRIFIGGYEMKKNGEFKRTLKAFYHLFF